MSWIAYDIKIEHTAMENHEDENFGTPTGERVVEEFKGMQPCEADYIRRFLQLSRNEKQKRMRVEGKPIKRFPTYDDDRKECV